MSIRYMTGDATRPTGNGDRIIAHVCNDRDKWGRGFAMAISQRWPEPERLYRGHAPTFPGIGPPLGTVQIARVEPSLWVANMIAQHGIRSRSNPHPIRYDALRDCLATLGMSALDMGASVHMPRIGTGLAGGSWDRVEPIIVETLIARGVGVTVYDPSRPA